MLAYEKASGQAICWQTSRILFSPNTPIHLHQHLTSSLGFIRNKRKDKYIGIPFLLGKRKLDLFDGIMDRINSCTNSWYTKFLSYAGRTTLIKSVINTIPAYTMSVSMIPSTCIKKIETLNRNFLSNAKKDTKSKPKIKWKMNCKPKHLVGLGIRDL